MTVSTSFAKWRLRQHAPNTRLASPLRKRQPLWPTFSIGLLLCLPSLFAPIALTVLNAMLVGLATAVVLFTKQRIDRRLLVVISIVSIVTCLGLFTGAGAGTYEYFKDAWYLVNPVLVLLTGYTLYSLKPDLGSGLRAFVIAGFLVACWQLRGYAFDPSIIQLSASQIRRVIGTGSYVPVVALAILILYLGKWRQVLRLPTWIGWILFAVMAAAICGVFSRTALVVVGIAVAALVGCFSKREWWRVGAPIVLLLLTGLVAQLYVDTESQRALDTFGGKLARTLQELTVGEGRSVRDINLNFRAYETDRALDQFSRGSVAAMMFGQGFGATVDLGITMPLEVTESGFLGVREIGIFHNGYIYLLTKVGLVGLMLYAGILSYLYRIGRQHAALPLSDPRSATGRLFQFAVVSLVATTYFIAGLFNKSEMFPVLLLIGFLLAHWRDDANA